MKNLIEDRKYLQNIYNNGRFDRLIESTNNRIICIEKGDNTVTEYRFLLYLYRIEGYIGKENYLKAYALLSDMLLRFKDIKSRYIYHRLGYVCWRLNIGNCKKRAIEWYKSVLMINNSDNYIVKEEPLTMIGMVESSVLEDIALGYYYTEQYKEAVSIFKDLAIRFPDNERYQNNYKLAKVKL